MGLWVESAGSACNVAEVELGSSFGYQAHGHLLCNEQAVKQVGSIIMPWTVHDALDSSSGS